MHIHCHNTHLYITRAPSSHHYPKNHLNNTINQPNSLIQASSTPIHFPSITILLYNTINQHAYNQAYNWMLKSLKTITRLGIEDHPLGLRAKGPVSRVNLGKWVEQRGRFRVWVVAAQSSSPPCLLLHRSSPSSHYKLQFWSVISTGPTGRHRGRGRRFSVLFSLFLCIELG